MVVFTSVIKFSPGVAPVTSEVMRRAACGDVCAPAPRPPTKSSENKELLRQQLLSASKERNLDKGEIPKVKHTRSRQKNRWKLKFHHQALPQEYLDHYEQSLQKVNNKKKSLERPKELNVDTSITNETFKIWAQRLAGVQSETGALTVPLTPALSMATKNKEEKKKKSPAITPSKIMTYEDLPYMGEMTLNNSKPRRGRKPKKADICHLIYENYGTVVPGQPPPADRLGLQNSNAHKNTDTSFTIPKTDLQNRIISSLLERKLCQEQKRKLDNSSPPRFCNPDAPPPPAPPTTAGPLHSDHEPLNLCIRDLHDLKLQIQRKFGNIYASSPEVKTELDDEDSVTSEQPNAISVIQRNTNLPPTARSSPSPSPSEGCAWPRPCGLYVHPLALQTQLLYYQRLAAAGQLPFATDDQEKTSVTPENNDVSADDGRSKLVLKQISELLDPKVIKQVEENKSPELPKKRVSPNPAQGPVKRKRSAIFIPPVPVKTNTTTPTTEVSICKFKFTGGSKPSLQEKKMLSVDSGGNFRYYSGTGGKSAKGYEYLHKDLNQQKTEISSTLPILEPQSTIKEDPSKKKRKSRKTLQREKLEQTFKEKGFLIQTQQLQSAEGATYCKFRQLRKFTRYLFRSWKDYLPGELNDHGAAPPGTPPTPPTPVSPLSPSTQASSLTPPAPPEWA